MTSVKESARAAQMSAIENGNRDALVGAQETLALYDGLDALSPEQRTLFISQALSLSVVTLKEMIDGVANGEPIAATAAYAMILNGLVAMSGYLNAVTREEAEYTVTGDSKVQALLDRLKDAVSASVLSDHTPEEVERVKGVSARVQARMAEDPTLDFATVVAEEAEAAGMGDLVKAANEHKAPAARQTNGTEDKPYGMYL